MVRRTERPYSCSNWLLEGAAISDLPNGHSCHQQTRWSFANRSRLDRGNHVVGACIHNVPCRPFEFRNIENGPSGEMALRSHRQNRSCFSGHQLGRNQYGEAREHSGNDIHSLSGITAKSLTGSGFRPPDCYSAPRKEPPCTIGRKVPGS